MLPAEQTALVKQYCVTCHNDRSKAGQMSLQAFDAAKLEEHGELTEKMIRKLRSGMMPPSGARRPEPDVLTGLLTSFESRMDRHAALNPNPGSRPFQRLNRAEYSNAVRDLLSVDVDVSTYLPPDTISHGFDNVADSQTFSPTLMDGYLRAASQISRLAVGDRNASATSTTYKIPRAASQMRRVDGAPMGTRGGTSVVHTFPADGHYRLKASLHYEPLGGLAGRNTMTAYDLKEQVEFSVNGERVAIFDLNTRMSETDPKNGLELVTPPVHIKAGPQRVTAAFVQKLDGPVDDLLMPLENTLADVSISLGHHHAAAPARLHRAGADGGHRRVGYAEPPEDLLVPPHREGGGRSVRGRDHQGPHDAGIPRRAHGRRSPGRDEVLRAGTREGRVRGRHPARRAVDPDEPALPVPPRAAARRAFAPLPIESPTRTLHRGCRSSCGARCRMRN